MGFRSTFVTEHNYLSLPSWFVEKYASWVHINGFPEKPSLPLSSKFEVKEYLEFANNLPTDLQKVMQESTEHVSDSLVLVWLHECGGITRIEIHKDSITYSEPQEWEITDGVTHNYCYGCSDVENAKSSLAPTKTDKQK